MNDIKELHSASRELLENLRLFPEDVWLFTSINTTEENQFFENKKHTTNHTIKIRTENSQNNDLLPFGLFMLAGCDNEEWLDNIKLHIEELLNCKYIITIDPITSEPSSKQRATDNISVTSRISDTKSSKIMVEQDSVLEGNCEISSVLTEKDISGRNRLTIPFFHLAFLTLSNFKANYVGLRKLIEYIIDKCVENMKHKENAEIQWMRNLEMAFTAKIRSSDPNLYINGMNVFHLASFHFQCSAFHAICEALDKINEYKLSIRYRFKNDIRNICKSAMTALTENSKETPSNIASLCSDIGNMKYFVRFTEAWAEIPGTELDENEKYSQVDCWYELPLNLDGESQIHYAVRNDWSDDLEQLLKLTLTGNSCTQASKKGQTPLHLAKSLEVVNILMDCFERLRIERFFSLWKKDANGNHAFQNLLKKDDRLAKRVLDYFVDTNQKSLDDENLIIYFNLKAFQDHERKNEKFVMDYHKYMVDCGSTLIYHPVSVVMTELIWTCKSKLVKYLYPMIQLIFTTFLTWMTFCEYDKSDKKLPMNSTEELVVPTTLKYCCQNFSDTVGCSMAMICKNFTGNKSLKSIESIESNCFIPALLTSVLLVFLIIFEIWQFARAPKRFFRKSENWLDLFMVVSTSASLMNLLHHDFSKTIKLKRIEESLGHRFFSGISIFLVWFKIVLLLQNLPKAGRYIRIFKIVSKELLFFLLIYLPVLIAFSACFFVLMPSGTDAFKNMWISSLKVFVMLVGELDYDGIFINNDDFEKENSFQTLFIQIMSICFLCLVSIVISNLLTGLAIKEIGKLMSEAWETDIKEKINELIEDEDVTYNQFLTCFEYKLLKQLNGSSFICIKPNEIIKDNKHGKFLELWNTITGQDITYRIYTVANYERIAIHNDESNTWTTTCNYEDHRPLEKTELKCSLKLITLTMEYLKSKEREKLEKSGKTLNQVWEHVERNRNSIENVEKMLEAICLLTGGKDLMLERLEMEKLKTEVDAMEAIKEAEQAIFKEAEQMARDMALDDF